ncbi:MAG: hypothetical protein MRZ18_03765 [Clostridiales bacterium]|nr:hypothetical protein [Clostridiales bacterium]
MDKVLCALKFFSVEHLNLSPADPANPATGDPADMAMFTVLTRAALAGAAAVLTLMKKHQVR